MFRKTPVSGDRSGRFSGLCVYLIAANTAKQYLLVRLMPSCEQMLPLQAAFSLKCKVIHTLRRKRACSKPFINIVHKRDKSACKRLKELCFYSDAQCCFRVLTSPTPSVARMMKHINRSNLTGSVPQSR